MDDIPHYFQYHLENPGADVLMAALRRHVQAPATISSELCASSSLTPPEIATIFDETAIDIGEGNHLGDNESAQDT